MLVKEGQADVVGVDGFRKRLLPNSNHIGLVDATRFIQAKISVNIDMAIAEQLSNFAPTFGRKQPFQRGDKRFARGLVVEVENLAFARFGLFVRIFRHSRGDYN